MISYLEFLLSSTLVSIKVLVAVNPMISPSLMISYPNKSDLASSFILNDNLLPFVSLVRLTST